MLFDVEKIRSEFPLLRGNAKLVYLDSAATAQKPQCVIDAVSEFYARDNANIHRGLYRLSQTATTAFEHARERVAKFLNARESRECVFTRGATEAINLVAASWGGANLHAGDEILLTEMEHHANIVPWQAIAERTGAKIVVAPIFDDGSLDVPAMKNLISEKTKIVGVTQTSNALGTVNPVAEICAAAHAAGALVLVDAAQSAAHFAVDVQAIGCDFLVFSGHKICGPTGIGVLYARAEILEKMPPYQFGGDMIDVVDFAGTTFRGIPGRFEAGTPNSAGAVGLGVALDYVSALRPHAQAHETALLNYATEKLCAEFPEIRIFGTAKEKASVISFHLGDIHPSDVGMLLDTFGVAVRVGHHCAMPLMKRLGITGTVRASFAFYNTFEEADRFVAALKKVRGMF
ncbi:MAG: cysteine desulfurase [Opitutales bacterium]|nr:cysteine desulfurase [Opitutales bacterium]